MNPLTLPGLQVYYTLRSPASTILDLLQCYPVLVDLLTEAVAPLRKAFGPQAHLTLRVQDLADERYVLVGIGVPRGAVPDPYAAMVAFVATWWVANAHRIGGLVVIDFEVIQEGQSGEVLGIDPAP